MKGLPYLPYAESSAVSNVVVDGSPNAGTVLTLSHWPGAPTPGDLRDDLSAQIAFHALARPELLDQAEVVTNNHFDQDGLSGVYTLWRPDLALPRRDLLIDVASAGDFGTFQHRDAARIAMAIATFDDYEPALDAYTDLLDHPHRHRDRWGEEDDRLAADLLAIETGIVSVDEHPEVDLAVFTTPRALDEIAGHRFTMKGAWELHPMALYRATQRLVIAVVNDRRYRLECRYETWVTLMSRAVRPRRDLRALAVRLDELEPAGARWRADAPGSLTPQLRLADDETESGLTPEQWLAEVRSHLAASPAAWDPFAPN